MACNVMQTHCMEKGSRRFLLEQLNVSGWKLVKIGKGLCGKFDDEDYSNQLGRPAPCPQNGDDDRSTFAAELSRSRTPDGVLHKKYDEGDYNDTNMTMMMIRTIMVMVINEGVTMRTSSILVKSLTKTFTRTKVAEPVAFAPGGLIIMMTTVKTMMFRMTSAKKTMVTSVTTVMMMMVMMTTANDNNNGEPDPRVVNHLSKNLVQDLFLNLPEFIIHAI